MVRRRLYDYKDVDMVMASKIIITNLKNNLAELSVTRSNWTEEYVIQLESKIDNAIDNYLGLDKKKELRDTTRQLITLQKSALNDISFLKTQIEVDFKESKTKRNNLLKVLGLAKNIKTLRLTDQEALIHLLYTLKKGLTDKVKIEIIEKGIDPALIERIIWYGDQIKEVNVKQESLKLTTKTITKEAATAFNEIYYEVIGICKIASKYYMSKPLIKGKFSFKKVVSNMNTKKSKLKDKETAA